MNLLADMDRQLTISDSTVARILKGLASACCAKHRYINSS